MTDTDIPPNLREVVGIMADAVQGMYVFTDNRECIEAECAAALRALLAVGFSVQRWEPIETAPKDFSRRAAEYQASARAALAPAEGEKE